jgi:threonine-phosphate decarboxylase
MIPHNHGGDLVRVARESGVSADCLLDFSANVNPMGLPSRAAERLAREAADPRRLAHYPDPDASELRRVLSDRLGVPGACVAIGAGADALIHAAVRALQPKRCLIPVPAFSEYERASRAYGCDVRTIAVPPEPGDLIVLNNPHNPTGACATREEMLSRIDNAIAGGCSVLADEAFIDYAPDAAITSDAVTRRGVIAIRSLTKFFGCPALRVGYAVAAPVTALSLAAQLPAWPVTTLALNALAEALQDADYARTTIQTNQHARTRLSSGLVSLGIEVFPSAANFLLIKLAGHFAASEIRDQLIRRHAILVRECDSFKGLEPGRYLRVAVRSESENSRLVAALASVFEGYPCQQSRL